MSERTNFLIEEQGRYIAQRDRGHCQKCQRRGWQMAHRIGKGKDNRAMLANWLREDGISIGPGVMDLIIHHRWNIVLSCDTCNSSFNIGNNPEMARALLARIWDDLILGGKIKYDEVKSIWLLTVK